MRSRKKRPFFDVDHSSPTENAQGAYAIRPYAGTSNLFFHPYLYPANFPGLGEALIFFCFFSCIKTRKEDYEGKKKTPFFDVDHSSPTENTQGAYAIRPYRLPADGFRIPPNDMVRNPAGFGLRRTT